MSKTTAVLSLALILQPLWALPASAQAGGLYPAVWQDVGPAQLAPTNPDSQGTVGGIRTVGPTFPVVPLKVTR
jgi:hypothetical protein